MCVLSIKVPIRKRLGNLFNDPCIYIYIVLGRVQSFTIFWYVLICDAYITWPKLFKHWWVLMKVSINVVVGALTDCALKAVPINVQRSFIRKLMLNEIDLCHNVAEAATNNCFAKGKSFVDHNIVTRWLKKFHSVFKNHNVQLRTGWPITVDPKAVLQPREANQASSTGRVSSEQRGIKTEKQSLTTLALWLDFYSVKNNCCTVTRLLFSEKQLQLSASDKKWFNQFYMSWLGSVPKTRRKSKKRKWEAGEKVRGKEGGSGIYNTQDRKLLQRGNWREYAISQSGAKWDNKSLVRCLHLTIHSFICFDNL